MSRHGSAPPAKGAARPVSWPAAVAAIPVTVLVWVVLMTVLTLVLADLALGGLIAVGVVAAIGCVLLLVPGPATRGSGIGTIATLIPCAIGLALSLL